MRDRERDINIEMLNFIAIMLWIFNRSRHAADCWMDRLWTPTRTLKQWLQSTSSIPAHSLTLSHSIYHHNYQNYLGSMDRTPSPVVGIWSDFFAAASVPTKGWRSLWTTRITMDIWNLEFSASSSVLLQLALLPTSLFIPLGTSLLAPQIRHFLTCPFININFLYLLTYYIHVQLSESGQTALRPPCPHKWWVRITDIMPIRSRLLILFHYLITNCLLYTSDAADE